MSLFCEPIVGVYCKHPTKRGFYELKYPSDFQFTFLVISPAKATYLKDVSANSVINCWHKKTKVLHSGLILCHDQWWYGDNVWGRNKDFILVNYLPEKEELILYLFRKYYPKKPFEFARKCVAEITLLKRAT